jgi:hypothetical protein
MNDFAAFPPSPPGRKMTGLGQMAEVWLGADTPKNRRRMSALLHEVPEADRLPYFLDGRQPAAFEGWWTDYAWRRRQNAAPKKIPADQ